MDESVSIESLQAVGLPALLRSTPPFDRLPEPLLQSLSARMTLVRLESGHTLLQKDDRVDAMYLVVSGGLQPSDGPGRLDWLGPGQLVGEIQILIGGRAPATLRASVDTELARLEKSALELLAKEAPQLLLALGALIRKRLRQEQLARVLNNVFGELDAESLQRIEDELEWVELRPGDALFQQGDASDCMYVVVSGRLVGVREGGELGGSARQVTVEIGRGECIGEMGFFTGETRSLGIFARRTSQLVRFNKPVFDRLSREHPHAMLYITQLLIRRLQRASGFVRASYERSNIVVLPVSPGIQATAFTERLVKSLRVHGETLYVNSSRLDAFIGVPGFAQTRSDSPLDLALDAGLDDRESGFRYAVYECDAEDSAWTRRCVERADRILLLADPGADPAVMPIEQGVLGGQDLTTARRTLVLLHPETTELPTGTRHWLEPRRLEGHLHIRRDRDADIARAARILTGNSIGAVLGGGGARGFAHLGAIRAFREAGIPIDLIGGTSMGALIAVQPALGWDDATMLRVNHGSFVLRKPISFRDYTLPVYSLVGGRRLDQSLMGPLGDVRIEDLWTGYFCVSSNLTRAQPMVHRQGPVWKAIRASISIPGIFRPVIQGADLLVDGGVLNNLPGDVMRQIGGGWVIAVDVSTDREMEVRGEHLPPAWKVMLNWFNPFAKPLELPSIVNLMQRTTLLASVEKTDAVRKLVDLYIQPRLERFGLMQFTAFEEVIEEGYRHAKESVAAWMVERPEIARMLKAAES